MLFNSDVDNRSDIESAFNTNLSEQNTILQERRLLQVKLNPTV